MAFVALCATFLGAGVYEQASAAMATPIKGVITYTARAFPGTMPADSPYRTFTIHVYCNGAANVPDGLYGTEVQVGPEKPELVDFVEFVPSTQVSASRETRYSDHNLGIIDVEAAGGTSTPAINYDFYVGGFRYKLKDSVTNIPDELVFYVVNMGTMSYLYANEYDVPTVTVSVYF